jgi:hypothetical protein
MHDPIFRDPELRDVTFTVVLGLVEHEQVYCRRTGRTTSVAMREIWIRTWDGAEWRLNANAHCAAVRAGHKVEALVATRGGCASILRIRNLTTGDDRILTETVYCVGGNAAEVAAMAGLWMIPGVLGLGLVLSLVGLALDRDIVDPLAPALLLLPFIVPCLVAAVLAPGYRRRRELLLARARQLDHLVLVA